jgi:uncharacterized protein (DUF885 family)
MMLRFLRAMAFLAALVPGLATASLAQSHSSDAVAFEALTNDVFVDEFRYSPSQTTAFGDHRFDALLEDRSAKAIFAHIDRLHGYLGRLGDINRALLPPEMALDATLIDDHLNDLLLADETMSAWRHNADGYVQTAVGSVFGLIERDFAPESERMRNTIARENAFGRLLSQARENLTSVDGITARLAARDADGSLEFIKETVPSAFVHVRDARLQSELARSTAHAAAALAGYRDWLERGFVAHPRGTFAIGAENYRSMLRYEEHVDLPLDQYLAVGEKALADTRAQALSLAHEIDPNSPAARVFEKISRSHPAAGGVTAAAERDLVQLRAFVLEHHLITLPADADIRVTLTPPFLRDVEIASMDAPGPLESGASRAFYNVTPPDPRWSTAAREAFLAGNFNDFERPITSAHEVYPGHYTNFIIDKHLPLSLTRKLLWSNSFTEGWAHYSEQMMVDEGWGNGDPRVRLAQLQDALLRECRFVVGVKLHTGKMTFGEAERFFAENAYEPAATAHIEATRATQDPIFGYYTLGKLEILKLREDYRKKLGPGFTLQKFHDALLAHGNPPVPLLRPLLLGAGDDGSPL